MLINHRHRIRINRVSGFSLIELMLAMLIGIIILGGVMQLYLSTRDTQRTSEDQLQLLSDARFVFDTIAYDLRHAGVWGGTNEVSLIACQLGTLGIPCTPAPAMPAAAIDCGGTPASLYNDLQQAVLGSDNANPYSGSCATEGYQAGSDVLSLRYADPSPIATGSLSANTAYVRSNISNGLLFIGPAVPGSSLKNINNNLITNNYRFISRVYYVSNYTDDTSDGMPSLHRVDLANGPTMEDSMLIPGVQDLQFEYGVDTNSDFQVDSYVNANNVTSWTDGSVMAVKIWILMRSERADREAGIAGKQTFTIAGQSVDYDDKYRRYLMSGVVRLRNMSRVSLVSAGGG